MAHCGVDFVLIGGEHGTYTVGQMLRLIEAAHAIQIPVFVRLPIGERVDGVRTNRPFRP